MIYLTHRHRLQKLRRRMMRRLALPAPAFKFVNTDEVLSGTDVLLRRTGTGLEVGLHPLTGHRDVLLRYTVGEKYVPFLHYFTQCDPSVTSVMCNASDGDFPSAARFSFSSFSKDVIPLPDLYFFRQSGYADLRDKVAHSQIPWRERCDKIVWRGGPNGNGLQSYASEVSTHPSVRHRIRMAWVCRNSEIDFRFVYQKRDPYAAVARRAGFEGERIPVTEWMGKKYAIDIDGFTNAWDNLYHRLLMGCCVLKVQSEFGFRQWYYDALKPYEHYVPVRADFSDLFEKVDWVRSNPRQAEQIAAAGQALAHSMTFESETARAVQWMTEHA